MAASAAMLVAPLALAACGSDGDGGKASSGGDTVKLGIVTSVGTRVDFKDVVASAEAAAAGINDRGGIDGKDVEIVFCNESLDPNKGRACVRDLVDKKVMAMTGMAVSTMEADAVKMLGDAGIANFAPFTYGAASNDPNTYLLNGGHNWIQASTIKGGVDEIGPKQAWVPFDLPLNQGYAPTYEKGLPIAGGKLVSTVKIPPTTTDMAPIASQISKSDAEGINIQMTGSLIVNLIKSLDQIGWDGKWVTADNAFVEEDLDLFPAGWLDKGVFASFYPPIAAADDFPGLQQYKKDVELAKAAGVKNLPGTDRFVRGQALNAYFSVIAAAQIADGAKATDAKSFKTAVESAKDVDLGGVIPPWTPTKSVSKVDSRVSNGLMWIYHWENGKAVLDTPQGVDVTNIWDGAMG